MNEKLVEEVESTPDASEVETQLIKVESEKMPEDVAAVFFHMQQPRLKALLDVLSVRQMRRLLFNVCSYPYVKEEYMPRTDQERAAAYLVHEMMLNKAIMQLSVEMQKAETALQNNTVNDTINTNNGEENGKV